MTPPSTCDEHGEPGSDKVLHHDLEMLTRLFLNIEDERDVSRSLLSIERGRRLNDLRRVDSLVEALAQSRVDADEVRARSAEHERRIGELVAQLEIIRRENDALREASWSPHMLRLRSLWRRLPGWVRGPIHRTLAATSRLLTGRR